MVTIKWTQQNAVGLHVKVSWLVYLECNAVHVDIERALNVVLGNPVREWGPYTTSRAHQPASVWTYLQSITRSLGAW